jgi:hypothetical protein
MTPWPSGNDPATAGSREAARSRETTVADASCDLGLDSALIHPGAEVAIGMRPVS